jgi:cell division protein FtsQ
MAKRKINIDKKKVRRTILWSLFLLGIFSLMVLSVQRKSKAELNKVYISIQNNDGSKALLGKKDVVRRIEDYLGYDLAQVEVHNFNLREVEDLLVNDARIHRAEVYLDSDDRLHIYVQSRKALARVKSASNDYYLGSEGTIIPVKGSKILRVPIVTGLETMVPDSFPNNRVKTIHNDVYEISKAASNDEFVEALIEQIHVDDNNEVWVIPKVGKEKLLLGDSQELDDRMKRLKILYKEGMKRSGFNQYAELHLKWRGQVTRVKG